MLGPAADKILAAYYIQNPIERIQRYIETSSTSIEYAKRFGADGAIEKNLQKQMGVEGVDQADQNLIMDALALALGRNKTALQPTETAVLSAISGLQNMIMLPRAMITSLPEAASSTMAGNCFRASAIEY